MNKNLAIIGTAIFAASVVFAITASSAGQKNNQPGCEIKTSTNKGMILLESRYSHEKAGSGTYKFTVRSVAGNSSVRTSQRGEFTKTAGEMVVLSKTRVSAARQAYEVKLDITFNGKKHKCSKKIEMTT